MIDQQNESDYVLDDVLQDGLDVVICGTAAGTRSAELGQYYAGPGNKFWPTLHEIGLTPRHLTPAEFPHLPEFGVGLTDLVKHNSGGDASLGQEDYDISGFREKILRYQPRLLAFNSKNAAAQAFNTKTKKVEYGFQQRQVGETRLFVLPSTSGAASKYWDAKHWHDMAHWLGRGVN
ncbi:MAG: mismatch-specific DNA-glycosylase [Parvularculales bacterium]